MDSSNTIYIFMTQLQQKCNANGRRIISLELIRSTINILALYCIDSHLEPSRAHHQYDVDVVDNDNKIEWQIKVKFNFTTYIYI